MMISTTATHRTTSLFSDDMAAQAEAMNSALCGKRILAIGAAGSIGFETVKVMLSYGPGAIHVIDQNENALAEVVRQLRSNPDGLGIEDFRTLPLDYGSAAMRLLLESGIYDYVLNFAAIKHVRSEKDVFSTLQMLDTNVLKQFRLRELVARTQPDAHLFCVSTDKAANPVSFMGATKRMMEHVVFRKVKEINTTGRVTSARFANVAYSNGSLLQSFQNRLAVGQALAAPNGIKRYFVSLEESGQLCTLASIICPMNYIAIPKLDPAKSLVSLQSVAERFLAAHNLKPRLFEDEAEAVRSVETCRRDGAYPLLITPSDTAGEKPYEEFIGRGEAVEDIGLSALAAVAYRPPSNAQELTDVLGELRQIVNGDTPATKDDIKALIARVEPDFLSDHIDSRTNLDQRV